MKKMMMILATMALALTVMAETKAASGTLEGQLDSHLRVELANGNRITLSKGKIPAAMLEGLAIGDQVKVVVEGSQHPQKPEVFFAKEVISLEKE